MNTTEVWQDIKGYEGYYQISNFGRVKSLERHIVVKQARYKEARTMRWRSKILKQHNDGKGYPIVRPCLLGKPATLNVHRLVAQHFIPNPHAKPAVNHIDSNPLNNHVSNLEWCTIAENNAHAVRMGRKPTKYKPRYA